MPWRGVSRNMSCIFLSRLFKYHLQDHPRNSRQSNVNYINGHMNLVAISTAVTPPEQRKKRAHAKKKRETESESRH